MFKTDGVANGDLRSFDQSIRVLFGPRALSLEIIPQVLEMGQASERQSRDAKARGTLPSLAKTCDVKSLPQTPF